MPEAEWNIELKKVAEKQARLKDVNQPSTCFFPEQQMVASSDADPRDASNRADLLRRFEAVRQLSKLLDEAIFHAEAAVGLARPVAPGDTRWMNPAAWIPVIRKMISEGDEKLENSPLEALHRYYAAQWLEQSQIIYTPYHKIGHAYAKLGKHGQAIICYRKAFECGRASPDTFEDLRESLVQLGEANTAHEELGRLVKQNPNTIEAYLAYARALLDAGRKGEVHKVLRDCRSLYDGADPKSKEDWNRLDTHIRSD